MGKRLYMGDMPVGDNVTTFNLEISTVLGVGSTTRHDDGGNPSSNPIDTVSMSLRNYIIASMQNQADLVGTDFNDELIGTSGDDLILWEQQRHGLGGPFYMLPSAGTAAIDNFILGAGNDLINLTYISDNNPATPDTPYTANANIDGGTGDDIIWSGQGNDNIFGGGGFTEYLYGGGGNDVIAGSGNAFNIISGDSGNDSLFGGSSSDGIVGGTEDDIAFGGAGNDDLLGESGNDTLFGGQGADGAFGGDGNDTVFGDGEDDEVDGGTGFLETLYGGTGNDHVVDPDGAKLVYGDSGNDRIDIGFNSLWNQGVPTIFGGSGIDTISVTGALNSTVSFVILADDATGVGDAADTVTPRGSYDSATVTLGGGDDRFEYVAFATNTGNRIDTVYGGAGVDTIFTGDGNDRLFGDAGNDTLQGGAGLDTLYGGTEADLLQGGDGTDTLFGGSANDILEGGVGADTMYGGSETDAISYAGSSVAITMGLSGAAGVGGDAQGDVAWTDVENLTGSQFSDSLHGNASVNLILGLGGDDTIEGLGGGDSLDGGSGSNWLSYLNSAGAVTVNLFTGTGSGGDAAGDSFANFQNLIGSALGDTLTGSAGSNIIEGRGGVDTIEGREGADSLFGGGNGDYLSYLNSDAGVTVSLLAGTGDGGHATGDVVSGFRHLIGSANGDSMIGDAQVNSITGGLGDDTVEGGAGGDFLFGGGQSDYLSYAGSNAAVTVDFATNVVSGGHATGDTFAGFINMIGSDFGDTLTGSLGNNIIIGGLGVDTVEGGGGDDVMYGGADTQAPTDGDWLLYNNAREGVHVSLFAGTATGGDGNDKFTSFQHLIGSLVGDDYLEGDDDNNTVIGQGGNDTIFGLAGIDTVYGGEGNDTILAGTNGGTFENTTIAGWDGDAGSAQIDVFVPIFSARVSDRMFGGNGTDTVDMQYLVTAPNSVFNTNDSNISAYLAGIEIIIAGAAADVINLTFNDGVTRSAYAENVSIFAGESGDVVFSGSGNDTIVGGLQAQTAAIDGGDTLYGGQGNDLIVGDDFGADNVFGGNDTVFTGAGMDTAYGGGGDDVVVDLDGGMLYGGLGSDLLVLRSLDQSANYVVDGGRENHVSDTLQQGDGNDQVFVGGNYNRVDSALGAGDDKFIASDVNGTGAQIDMVRGGSGNDLISAWYGNDVLYGDDSVAGAGGNDVIWGGAGSDTIYGGEGTDILYGGAGDGDVLVGGAGIDYYYWSRTDGVDMIIENDPNPVDPVIGSRINALVVFPDWDTTELTAGSDQLRNGTGVFEVDHDLYDNNPGNGADMVQLVDIDGAGGSMYRLDIIAGAGAGNSMTFDQRDVSTIILWNNDAVGGTPVVTQYVWDPVDQRYEFAG